MKFSLSWLKRYIEIDKTPDEIEEALNLSGLEVEGVETLGVPTLEKVVVGEVVTREQHPNADRLSICEVKTGETELHHIVCGAQNFKTGDRVPVALPGAILPGNFKIKKSKLRGVKSEGMMCSARELNLGDDHSGLLILEKNLDLGTPINEVFPEGEIVFDLAVTPNRPDALSVIGIARELAALFDLKITKPELKEVTAKSAEQSPFLDSVEVNDHGFCPFYTAYSIKGVKIGPSPDWLRKDLEDIGLRPINNVVDITNWVLMETGQPLHAFDAAKLNGKCLKVRMANENEKITTLDEKERVLSCDMGVIADAERPLVIAGVMGSIDAEVNDGTRDIVLESAWFKPESVRLTSRRLGLSSDSSYRFERHVDPEGVAYAARRAIDLILEIAGGTLLGEPKICGIPPSGPAPISVTPSYFIEKLGFNVEPAAIKQVLESLGLCVEEEEANWSINIPPFRPDLERPIDLVEEFLRIHGTHNIPASPVRVTGLHAQDDPLAVFGKKATTHFAANGFNECNVYSTRANEEIESFFGVEYAEKLKLANPLASDQTHLRASLLPGLLEVMRLNQARGNDVRRLFEKGQVFHVLDHEVVEMVSIGFIMLQEPLQRHWKDPVVHDFFTAKQFVMEILHLAGISEGKIDFQPMDAPIWQTGHCSKAGSIDDGLLLECGVLDHQRMAGLDLKGTILAGTCCFTAQALRKTIAKKEFRPVSDFPPANRDLALVMDAEIPAGQVLNEIRTVCDEACTEEFDAEDISIFDVYEGEHLPTGRKSIAFAISFRSMNRTLKEKEVNHAFETITKAMTDNTPYELRS
ncbi:MAG: phenylalanine--tRNA ligase subunit beta [Opitutae bacterium]|nr:phenylalanine--tRNA ligase subunit beta [Opitutae bacterium]MBT4223381.1 phenylalanine--tRNA ligase subunit beta [Opitutae bacterium]MBT5379842.1 phenylalanine--tRNA ligase subunit beta [Opitutae bacterium]MBT6463398.1 phenylalanine--tRNA ligase subunit beta [Opitutae bacterium]MBT6957334.1 phenylalanine--tRNA ligase subunit beta [Opitutae bacterium]